MYEIFRCLLHDATRSLDLDVSVDASTSLGELFAAIDGIERHDAAASVIWVDGVARNPSASVVDAGLRNGSTISMTRPSLAEEAPAVARLTQLAGASGAGSIPLPVGRFDFSPSDDAPTTDFRVSGISFSLDVATDGSLIVIPRDRPAVVGNQRIADPSRLSTDVLNIGTARFADADATSADRASVRAPIDIARTVEAPQLPAEHHPRLSLRWLALLPIAIGLAVLGELVSPLLFIGSAIAIVASAWFVITEYRSERRQHADSRARRERAAADFEASLSSARRSIETELRSAQPPLVKLADAVTEEGAAGLWERPVGHTRFGTVTLAYGEVPWPLEVKPAATDPLLSWAVKRNADLTSVPITASFADGPIGIVGRRNVALACARAVVLEAVLQTDPDHLAVALAAPADRLDDWDWLKWVPHVDLANAFATTDDEADALVGSWAAPTADRFQLVVVDQTDWFTDDRALTSILGEPGSPCPVIVASTAEQLPACAAIIVIGNDGLAEVQVGSVKTSLATPAGSSARYTETTARNLARTQGPAVELHETPPSEPVRRFRLKRRTPLAPERSPTERSPLVPPPIPTAGQAIPEQPIVDLTSTREQLS